MATIIDQVDRIVNAINKASTATSSYTKRSQELKNAQEALWAAWRSKSSAAYKKAREDLVDLVKTHKQFEKEIERIKNGLTGYKGTLNSLDKSFEFVKKQVGQFTSSITKMLATLGVSTVSFGKIITNGIEYDKALFRVVRTQNVAGRGALDMSRAFEYVKKNTALAKQEFIELAETIVESFVGIPPTLSEMADMVAFVGRQVGPSIEAQKKAWTSLLEIQKKFPQLYEDVDEARRLLDKVYGKNATKDDAQRLEILRTTIMVTQELQGASEEQLKSTAKLLGEVSDRERELLDIEENRKKMEAELKDAALDLYNSMRPGLVWATKKIKEIIEWTIKWKEVLLGVGAAFIAIGAAVKTLIAIQAAITAINGALATMGVSATVALGPFAAIAAAIVVVAGSIGLIVRHLRVQKELQEKLAKESLMRSKMEKDIAVLTKEQKDEYNKLLQENSANLKTVEDNYEMHTKIMVKLDEEEKSATRMVLQYRKMVANVESQLNIINMIKDALEEQVNSAEKFGLTSKETWENIVKYSQDAAVLVDKALTSAIQGAKESLEKINPNIKINISGDSARDIAALKEQFDVQKDFIKDEKSREALSRLIGRAEAQLGAKAKANLAITEAQFKLAESETRQMENFTTVYEKRLQVQRDLMESAQFGLGASVAMMQKQVDLSYEMMQTYERQQQIYRDQVLSIHGVTEEQIKILENAHTQAEAEEYITKVMHKQGQEAMRLGAHWSKNHEVSTKIMQQQKKIYDLTKEVREGYLDAIREMSVGAGEFSKIIGTQEMGVTQLMQSVKGVTKEARLNTMALGGLQEQSLTQEGVGTQVGYRYGMGGLEKGVSPQEERRRLGRIYRYQESVDKVRGGGGRPIIGTAIASNERDKEAIKEGATISGQVQGEIVADAITKAMGGRNTMQGFVGSPRNLPGQYPIPGNYAGGAAAANLGARQLYGSQGQVADVTGGPNLAKGPMRVPIVNRQTGIGTVASQNVPSQVSKKSFEELSKELQEAKENRALALEMVNTYKPALEENKAKQKELQDLMTKEANRLSKKMSISGLFGFQTESPMSRKMRMDYEKLQKEEKEISGKLSAGESMLSTTTTDYERIKEAYDIGSEEAKMAKKEKIKAESVAHKRDISDSKKRIAQQKAVQGQWRKASQEGIYGGIKWGDKATAKFLEAQKGSGVFESGKKITYDAPLMHGETVEGGVFAAGVKIKDSLKRGRTRFGGTMSQEARRQYAEAAQLREAIGIVKPSKGQTEREAVEKAIRSQVVGQESFEGMSDKDYQELVSKTTLASQMNLAASAKYKGVATQIGSVSKEQRDQKVASEAAQQQFTVARAAMTGGSAGTVGGGSGGGSDALLSQINDRLASIEAIISRGVPVSAA